MIDRTMIVVAGGASSRFGEDKLTMVHGGRRLLDYTIDAVLDHVDQVVLAVRHDLMASFQRSEIVTVAGGDSRTKSETAGLSATPPSALIGIHDGARPVITPDLIDALFEEAASRGGAVPALDADGSGVDNEIEHPTRGMIRVQTPQVFWGPELRNAYYTAERAGFEGPDTLSVVSRFSNLDVAVVPGDPDNIKVTFPEDLERVARLLSPPGSKR